MGSVNPPSPARIEEHKSALAEFLRAYHDYLDDYPDQDATKRVRVMERIPAADRAMVVADVVPVIIDPPLWPGRQSHSGLTNLAFMHEQGGYRLSNPSDSPAKMVSDSVLHAIAALDQLARDERRRRRNPLYWIDRGIRYVLAIPAYIVSRIVGTSVEQIDRSAWGLLLRVIGLVADGFAIYFGGDALGVW
jgi:hypothetical protein